MNVRKLTRIGSLLGFICLVLGVSHIAWIEYMRDVYLPTERIVRPESGGSLCQWEYVRRPDVPKVIGIHETRNLTVSIRFTAVPFRRLRTEASEDAICKIDLSVYGPAFSIEPKETELAAPIDETDSAVIAIAPNKMGSHTINVYLAPRAPLQSPIGVVNTWGLTVRQAQAVNWALAALGFVLMLPWLKPVLSKLFAGYYKS